MDGTIHSGMVVAFDDRLAYGEVEDAATKRTYFFHCTQIADATRTIEVATPVTFSIVPGRMGQWEAVAVQPLGAAMVASASEDTDSSFVCPVCDAPVSGDPGTYEICPVCGWEDDPVQRDDPEYRGGANTLSLHDARADWRRRQSL